MSLPHLGFNALPPEFAGLKEWEARLHDLPGSRPFGMARFALTPGGRTPPDSHAVTELWLVLEGRGTLRYQGASHEISAGDLLGFAPFAEHEALADRGGPLAVLSLWWQDA